MKTITTSTIGAIASWIIAFAPATPVLAQEQEMPEMPQPQKEHEWLRQLEGNWESDMKIHMTPGEPPTESKSNESARMLGGFWIVSEGKGEMMGSPFSSILTIGYDTEKKKYVGTWIDSAMGRLWVYEGTLDESGRILTLGTEGFCPMRGEHAKFRDIVEMKAPDHKTITSQIQMPDGEWVTMVEIDSRKK
jgi:hypothetical protein